MKNRLEIINFLTKPLSYFQIFLFLFFISLILYHPYLINKFFADDYLFVSILEEQKYPLAGFWSIDAKEINAFQNIWWKDEYIYGKFFRPLPSIIFASIYWIDKGSAALILHFTSILLHSLVALSVYLIFYKLTKIYSVSLLASFIFLISEDHNLSVGWISANTDLFAVLFINLSIYYHVKFRETDQKKYKKISHVLMIFSFLSKETAIIGPVAIILYEFILVKSDSSEKNIFRRVFHKTVLFFKNKIFWNFHFFLLLIFIALYRLSGFGTNSLMYINPFRKPIEYIKNVIVGLPTMLMGLLTPFPVDYLLFNINIVFSIFIIGIILYLIFTAVMTPHWKIRIVHYSFILFTISLLLQLVALPSSRLLYFPFVFGSFLIAFLILNIDPLQKYFLPNSSTKIKILKNITGYFLILSTIILPLILNSFLPKDYIKDFLSINEVVNSSKKFFEPETRNVIYLTTSSPLETFYLNDISKFEIRRNLDVYPLSSFEGNMKIKFLSHNSFILETNSDGWLNNFFAKIVRVYPKFEVGKKYSTKLFEATILKTNLKGNDIHSVKFKFYEDLNSKSNLFLFFDGEKLNKFSLDQVELNNWITLKSKK